jgi:hypothetical protein
MTSSRVATPPATFMITCWMSSGSPEDAAALISIEGVAPGMIGSYGWSGRA